MMIYLHSWTLYFDTATILYESCVNIRNEAGILLDTLIIQAYRFFVFKWF